MEYTFIYPNQLYENHPAVSRSRKIILIEDPLFFGDDKYPIKFHKQKLLLHHMSMRQYFFKKRNDGYDIEIINFSDLKREHYTSWLIKKYSIHVIHVADVVDYEFKNVILPIATYVKKQELGPPNLYIKNLTPDEFNIDFISDDSNFYIDKNKIIGHNSSKKVSNMLYGNQYGVKTTR